MPIIKASDAPTFQLPGTTFTGLASPRRGSTETSVWHVRIAPGTQGTPHQLTREEIFVCVGGIGTAQVGSDTFQLSKGDAIVVPPLTDLALSNTGTEDFRIIAVFPVGGQAVLPGAAAFTPPWAE